MECKRSAILFVLIVSLIFYHVSATRATISHRSVLEGGFQPTVNPLDFHIVAIAQFAVAEHNLEASDAVVYLKVVSCEEQIVEASNYKLVINALDKQGKNVNYVAGVYRDFRDSHLTLVSFDPAQ